MPAAAASTSATQKSVTTIPAHPAIPETGVKGFLKWMKSDPVMKKVYAKIKPQLQQLVGGAQLGYFGDDTSSSMIDVSVAPAIDTSALYASTPTVGTIPDDSITAAAPSSSSGSSSWLSSLSSLVSAAGQAVLTADQISTASKVTGIQLTRAQQGLAPLNLNSYGLSTTPGVSLGLSASTQNLLMWGIGGIAAVWLLTSLFKHRGSPAA